MLLGTLGASLLANLLWGNGAIAKRRGRGIVRAEDGAKRVDIWLKKNLIPPHPLKNFEIQKYYENEPRFHCVFSRDNLPKTINNGAYVINLGEYAYVGKYWIALFFRKTEIVYFDVLVLSMFLKKLKSSLEIKTLKQIFLEYKQVIQYCVDTFALDSLILCLQIKNWLIL